jgi:hypothetical protein
MVGFVRRVAMRTKLTALRSTEATTEKLCSTGKRNAARNKSRSTVDHSALVLRGPTSPPTAGRKPEASPPISFGVGVAVDLGVGVAVVADLGVGASSSQLKSGAVACSPSHALTACPSSSLNDSDISELRSFFELLDQWDRRGVE